MINFSGWAVKLNSPWFLALVAGLFYSSFLARSLINYEYDFSRFIELGDVFTDADQLDPALRLTTGSGGYDGQFYYRLALDPLTRTLSEGGVTFDNPALRQQRIVYPAAAWLISGGNPSRVPTTMVAINFVALLAVAWLAGTLARSYGRHALWGSLIAFYPGLVLTLTRDLTELVTLAFIMASIVLYQRSSYVALSITLTAAVMSRETAAISAFALAAFALYRYLVHREPRARALLVATSVPIGAFVAWQAYIGWVWQGTALAVNATYNVTILPLKGLLETLSTNPGWFYIAEAGLLLASVAIAGTSLRSSRTDTPVKIAWLCYLPVFLLLSANVWAEDWAFLRAAADFFALGALVVLGQPRYRAIQFTLLVVVLALLVRISLRLT